MQSWRFWSTSIYKSLPQFLMHREILSCQSQDVFVIILRLALCTQNQAKFRSHRGPTDCYVTYRYILYIFFFFIFFNLQQARISMCLEECKRVGICCRKRDPNKEHNSHTGKGEPQKPRSPLTLLEASPRPANPD